MFKIVAALTRHTVGDFMTDALFASAIRELFDEAELHVYVRPDRPYKKHIAKYIRNATSLFFNRTELPAPLDFVGTQTGLPQDWLKLPTEFQKADFLITGSTVVQHALNCLPLPTLQPPDEEIEYGDNELLALGLDPSKWVAAVYWKEEGYNFRGSHWARTITDPQPYIAAIRHIVENLGGQVIRLGHPSPTQIPPMPGVFDLAHRPNSDRLQLYAVSICRFLIASASGPSAYGGAFGVPTALTDHLEVSGAWRDHDYIVTQGFFSNGRILQQQEALEAGFLRGYPEWQFKEGVYLRRNTDEELIAVADEMYHATTNCIGWRSLEETVIPSPRPNAITVPMSKRQRTDLLIPPSRRAKL